MKVEEQIEIYKAIKKMTDPGDQRVVPQVFMSFICGLKENDVEKIQNVFSSDSIFKKGIRDYGFFWMKESMPYLSIQVGTLSGGVTKSDFADSCPKKFKERYLEDAVNRVKNVFETYAAIALRKALKIFFGEEISEGELAIELLDEVTATFLSHLKKSFVEHRENIKNPEFNFYMKGVNFPDYYLEGMYWEGRRVNEGEPSQKTEETIIQESLKQVEKDYENCVANVNQLRQEFSLPSIVL